VRESPTITLIETLIGRGYHVRIFDNNIQLAHLFGANKNYLDIVIPHITTLMCETIKALIEESEVIVIANNAPEYKQVPEMMKEDQLLIDLVGIVKNSAIQEHYYAGICW
jgi:GDP-mannose 6-dehydrogenase